MSDPQQITLLISLSINIFWKNEKYIAEMHSTAVLKNASEYANCICSMAYRIIDWWYSNSSDAQKVSDKEELTYSIQFISVVKV